MKTQLVPATPATLSPGTRVQYQYNPSAFTGSEAYNGKTGVVEFWDEYEKRAYIKWDDGSSRRRQPCIENLLVIAEVPDPVIDKDEVYRAVMEMAEKIGYPKAMARALAEVGITAPKKTVEVTMTLQVDPATTVTEIEEKMNTTLIRNSWTSDRIDVKENRDA